MPKTGRAAAMRAWMKDQPRAWTVYDLCVALGIPPGLDRDRVRVDIGDFVKRGEIVRRGEVTKRKRRQNLYGYVGTFRTGQARTGALRDRIYKAMYVSCGEFALTDIRRLAGQPGRSYLDKIIGALRARDYVQIVGRRPCAHGAGAENLYRIANRDRFRLEVMR